MAEEWFCLGEGEKPHWESDNVICHGFYYQRDAKERRPEKR